MRRPLHLRSFTAEEKRVISKPARSQSTSKRLVERAKQEIDYGRRAKGYV